MENASKALIIVATLIIGVLLVWIFVRIFTAGASVNETYDRKQLAEQLELYNSKFELYAVEDNTIMDLITVANLAYSINEETDYDVGNNVLIEIRANNQTFSIPNTRPQNSNEGIIGANEICLEKNIEGHNGRIISIYKLATDTLGKLGIETIESNQNYNDKLTTTKYTVIQSGSNNGDSVVNRTIYKYLFRCTNILYEHSNGKVSKMTFEMYENVIYNNS